MEDGLDPALSAYPVARIYPAVGRGVPTTFCPSCGCGATFHDRLLQFGRDMIAHCGNCGPCWKTANEPFVEEVRALTETER